MLGMSNRTYLRLWTHDLSESTMLEQFRRLLDTVPFSAARPGFSKFVVRAVDAAETPLVEGDLRNHPLGAAEIATLTAEYLNSDSAYIVAAHWDLWVFDDAAGAWQLEPQRLEIVCHGEDYDGGVSHEVGNFQADLGFEHMFTGHAGLLRSRERRAGSPQHPAEALFLARMTRPDRLREYHEKTRENIQQLLGWVRRIERALPVERYRMWSEGEENFEACLDDILAAR